MNKEEVLAVGKTVENSSWLDTVAEHPFITLFVVIALLVAILFAIRLFFKFVGNFKNQKEVASLRKDLMVWSVLSSLVHGGKKTDKAKAEINSKLSIIDANFAHIKGIIHSQKFFREGRPWFVLLGEPSCGKSSLIENSELEFKCSDQDREGKKQPIKFYYGSGSVVADVSGKVFFDSWANGSSAEWTHICNSFREKNYKRPLDGVILTISADSLLADDRKLTQRKAQLIADEMARLVGSVRMNLPCYVVITKCDMILGFREYFQNLNEKFKDQIFGFQPLTNSGIFSHEEFDDFFESLTKRLNDGAVSLMGGKGAMDLTYSDRSRMDLTGNIYLFPHALSDIRANLLLYLEKIFSKLNEGTVARTPFSGVFFTSALDHGVCFDPSFAQLQQKTVDDAPLVDNNFKISRPYFINSLLSGLILRSQSAAVFISRERLRRRVPVLSACFLCGMLSVFYLYGAIFAGPYVHDMLEDDRLFYDDLSTKFDTSLINGAPLLGSDFRGKGVLMTDSVMPDNPRLSRINYFTESQLRLMRNIDVPLSFFPASMLKFGLDMDVEKSKRYFLYNQLQTRMAFLPLIDSVENSFITLQNEPMTLEKRNALFELLNISLFRTVNKAPLENDVYDSATMNAFIDYLYPQITDALKDQITTFKPGYDYLARSTNRRIILEPNYRVACLAGIKDLVSGWQNIANYPLHEYSRLRADILAAGRMIDIASELRSLQDVDIMNTDRRQMQSLIQQYRRGADEFDDEIKSIDELVKFVTASSSTSLNEKKSKEETNKGKQLTNNSYSAAFESSYQSYRNILSKDFLALEKLRLEMNAGEGNSLIFGAAELGSERLREAKSKSELKVEKDHQQLHKVLDEVQSDCLFANVDPKNIQSDLNYQVISKILSISLLSEVNKNIKSPYEINTVTNSLIEDVKNRHAKIDDLCASLPEDSIARVWASSCSKFLDLQLTAMRMDLVDQVLAMFPDTVNEMNLLSDLTIMVADYDGVGSGITDSVSFDMVRELLGNIDIRQEYQPDGFIAYANTIASLCSYTKEDKSFPFFSKIMKESQKLQRLIRVFRKYAGNYINYWGHFADALHPRADSYIEFYALVTNTRAYQVNSQLTDLFELSRNAVYGIDDELLDEGTASLKKATVAKLDTKIKSVDINFTDSCNDEIAAWAALSDDATYANRQVMQMSEKDIKNSLQLLEKSPLSWWSVFTALGSRLLKRDASQEASTSVAMYQSDLKVFPLIKDGDPHRNVLSRDDMRSLMAMFKSFGLTSKNSNSDQPNELSGMINDEQNTLRIDKSLKAPLVFSEDPQTQGAYKTWSETMENLLTVLSTTDRTAYYKLMRVGAATQQRLAKEQGMDDVESGITRYRYFSITIGKSKQTERLSSFVNSVEPETIIRGTLNNEPITFCFYRYSDSDVPDCKFVIDGGYPALQLYLDEKAVFDEESKTTYVPFVLKEKGIRSLFYIAFQTAVKLPPASQWPSLENWPSLTVFNDRSR